MDVLQTMLSRLNDADKARLKAIYAPKVVCVQPCDSRRDMCVMRDGELRSYGYTAKTTWRNSSGKPVYLSSQDCGLSWKEMDAGDEASMCSAFYCQKADRYLSVESDENGTFCKISHIGPGDESPRLVRIDDRRFTNIFLPTMFDGDDRVYCTGDYQPANCDSHSVVMYSDDFGDSWKSVLLESAARFTIDFPHKGLRWENSGLEPTLAKLPDDRLLLQARTSLDYMYFYESSDRGEHWDKGRLSDFHCTLTTSMFFRLSDGRTLLFWNNNRPLAEQLKTDCFPPLDSRAIEGRGEDVFTNRDVCHCAITDDFVTWRGFREIYLSDIRNASDYRTNGGLLSSLDKSVQQFQAIELPFGKVLLAFGQHEASRRTVIFDVNWLLEDSRSERFESGLANLSTHMFVKSISGDRGIGHCQWNRTNGALLLPDPFGEYREALQIGRVDDDRLVYQKQGAVWNFPASKRGSIKLELSIFGEGLSFCLCDHFINPCDPHASLYGIYFFTLAGDILEKKKRHTIEIDFDLDGQSTVKSDGKLLFSIQSRAGCPHGISYLHMQSLAEKTDIGCYIHSLEMKNTSGK